jgi:hypothetical protein
LRKSTKQRDPCLFFASFILDLELKKPTLGNSNECKQKQKLSRKKPYQQLTLDINGLNILIKMQIVQMDLKNHDPAI